MKTLKELTEKITQLQNEMNPHPSSQVSNTKPNHNQPKTKTDVGLAPSWKQLLSENLNSLTDLVRQRGSSGSCFLSFCILQTVQSLVECPFAIFET